ncbi:MAG: rane-associated lipoprotein involved in thiamine biosynthesis [Planctomycetaceae bacterium]|nr:rane-associated lipoprotein involved in thiamine biosynthesis [Planctomycetaceae bacterium]
MLSMVLAVVYLSLAFFQPALSRFDFSQRLMGISFDVTVYAPNEKVANETVEAAYARVRKLNAIFSDYEPDSELNRLCKTAGTSQAVAVSPELWEILLRSVEYSKRSDGAFDITVGPLVRLWRKSRKAKQLPTPEQIAAARSLVGYQKIRLNHAAKSVELTQAGMQLDLGGIAVGYACDDLVKLFQSRGLNRFMIDASGDILLGDPPPGEKGWKIGVAPLLKTEDAPPSRHVSLQNAAVSTSGDAFQHVEFNGVRYSHIVDPKTGLGLTDRSTVVVIAKDCTAADALSTTVSILGPEKGLQLLANQPGTSALIIRAAPGTDQLEVVESPSFAGFSAK